MGKRRANSPAGSGDRKSGHIQIRVGEDEKQAFGEAARLSGLALSAWIRERLRQVAKKELEEANRPVPFLDTADPSAPKK